MLPLPRGFFFCFSVEPSANTSAALDASVFFLVLVASRVYFSGELYVGALQPRSCD